MSTDVMSTDAPPPGIDQPRVDAWLAAHVPDAVPPFTYEQIMGGGSNLTFRVSDAEGRQWALRRPPTGPILATAHDMGREVKIMSALAPSPVAVPGLRCVLPGPRGNRRAVLRHDLRRRPRPSRSGIDADDDP